MLRVIDEVCDLPIFGLEGFEQAAYLRLDFFHAPGAQCCLWMVEGCCVSLLRLEPWKDGLLLTGLETLPNRRNCGYAAALLTAVAAYCREQGNARLYSHIDHRNAPSIRVHEKCGFRRISDTAKLLDGTVTARMGTYLLSLSYELP